MSSAALALVPTPTGYGKLQIQLVRNQASPVLCWGLPVCAML